MSHEQVDDNWEQMKEMFSLGGIQNVKRNPIDLGNRDARCPTRKMAPKHKFPYYSMDVQSIVLAVWTFKYSSYNRRIFDISI